MNAGQLRKFLANVADDTLILTPGRDHSYREVGATIREAAKERSGFSEWSGDQADYATPVKVIKAVVFE